MDLFDLVATLTLDTSQYDKGLDDSEEKGKGFGSGLAKAGGIAVAAIGAASVAVGHFAKKSVSAYAEYEQLAGGVEKIFDEANISQIMDDANNAYKNLNMSANEYLASINQTGAAFAQTMGDQKGYEVAKQGMQAIADYASGTGRNLNELNDKYSMITRSTSSYQSIADQFSGILPATSKGFLDQAKAAGFLSSSYTKLTDVPIEEYQEAVTRMLEKGVTDMGLYGNTARESATTIQGSLAMTKTAWENLVAGLANPDADIGQLIDNLVTAIVGDKEGEGLLNQIIPAVKRAVEGIGTFLTAAIPKLAKTLPSLIETFLPVAIDAIISLVTSIATELPNIITTLVNLMPKIIEKVVKGLLDAITAAVPVLVKAAPEIIKAIITGILNTLGTLMAAADQMIASLLNSIVNGLTNIAQRALEFARKIPEMIRSGLGSLWAAGASLIDGLWGGIKSRFDSVIARVKSLASALPDAVKKVLGIASPSKVFMELGKWIPEGLALGIEKNMGSVYDARDAMADATEFTTSSSSSNSVGYGNQIISYINIYDANNAEEVADVITKRLSLQMRSA